MTPPASSGLQPPSPKPTMNRPMPTTAIAINIDPMVIGMLYRICCPGIVKPSMAMKCIVQIPVAPTHTAARHSQRDRSRPVYARALVTQRSPRKAPRQDTAYARAGFNRP